MSQIDYYYSAYSLYAYLGSKKFLEIAKKSGRSINHKPVCLVTLMVDNGNHRWEDRTEENLHYFFRRQKDRWAEFHGIPIIKDWPSNHSVPEEPSNTLIIAAIKDGHDVDKLVHAMMYAHWVNDANLSNLDDLTKIINSVGLNADKLVEASDSSDVLDTYNKNTEEAVTMSVFGSPTYVIDDDMFYGQDSLGLVEYALNQPFQKTNSE